MKRSRQISGIEIELFEHGGQEFVGIKFLEILPIEIAAIDHATGANVKKIYGDLGRLGIPSEHVGVIAGGGGNLLALLDLFEGVQEIAVTGGLLVTLAVGGLHHALAEAHQEVMAPALQKSARVAGRLRVFLLRSKTGHTRAPAALNVILQAGTRMRPGQVHGAGRNSEVFVNE